MNKNALAFTLLSSTLLISSVTLSAPLLKSESLDLITSSQSASRYILQAQQQNMAADVTWQRLMYADQKGKSEVSYDGYFFSDSGRNNLNKELDANIQSLFDQMESNQSIRCRFPARSEWLIQRLNIPMTDLPKIACPELDEWMSHIKPHKATLIYATDFMGNPSSMFGHTLLRLDPKNQKELNLVSYAVNYAATVNNQDNWSYAWKGLVGKYPGEYSLMPYYRKVKEYGDFESRDLWEYELNFNEKETQFLVKHLWEMKHVTFPYYFVSDNCAYRLLGLIDLVRPNLNLKDQFAVAAIPIETIKAIAQKDLIKETIYRPALETQLLSQAKQHGSELAKQAHTLAFADSNDISTQLNQLSALDRAKVLEMAYDDLYLQFIGRQIDEAFAQPRLRQLLVLRSQIKEDKQRKAPETPKVDPIESHHARNLSIKTGEVQGQSFVEVGHRQAYHDLIDPQGGYRIGTQLMFLDFSFQYRDDHLKLNHLDLLSVNSFNPITPFKTPLSWGFNVGWHQQSLDGQGQFSELEQHGVLNIKSQFGYSVANQERKHLCYVQVQNQFQAGKILDKGWRLGIGPTLGCQNIWNDRFNTLNQIEVPYWEDSRVWNMRFNSNIQFQFNSQNALRFGWEYQSQQERDWDKWNIAYLNFF